MANRTLLAFRRRHNEDGTWDSICLRCYRTAATARDASWLPLLQSTHTCDPMEIHAWTGTTNGEHLEGSTVRVLVVDDYEPFLRIVCRTLGGMRDTQVIGEASDGLNAIRKAEELQPDMIVLDIGLPALNGIEAGRRIRKLCPYCKILFLSQESSVELAQEAFNLGASAYVVKAHAGSELSAAVEAVCQGRRFVSKGLPAHNRTDATDKQAPGHFFQKEVSPAAHTVNANDHSSP
jgi:DNA-binding NarL/FixJ family response regulator